MILTEFLVPLFLAIGQLAAHRRHFGLLELQLALDAFALLVGGLQFGLQTCGQKGSRGSVPKAYSIAHDVVLFICFLYQCDNI